MKPNYANYDIRAGDVPRDLFPRGRVKFSLGVPRSQRRTGEDHRRRTEMEKLRHLHAWDLLHAIQHGRLNVAEVSRRIRLYGEAAIAELRRELDAAGVGPIPVLREEAEKYLGWYEKNRGPQSLQIRRSRLRRLNSAPVYEGVSFGEIRIDRVVRSDVEAALSAVGGRANTRESYRVAISGLLSWSIREEQELARKEQRAPRWSANPAKLVEGRARESRVGTVSDAQVLRLLAAAEPHQEAYVRAFVHLGLRQAELQHSRLGNDLKPDTWVWNIQPRGRDSKCTCLQCKAEGWSPKNRRGIRSFRVPAHPPGLRKAIMHYLQLYPANEGDFVFRNPRTGGVWVARSLADDFRVLCERADVPYGRDIAGGITLHTLRHTCATNLVRAGVGESIIAGLLGDTVKTIADTYVNLEEDDLAGGVTRGPSYDEAA
jgi:integrase